MHASMGYMMHLAIADRNGNSAAIEYINNEMIVTEFPAGNRLEPASATIWKTLFRRWQSIFMAQANHFLWAQKAIRQKVTGKKSLIVKNAEETEGAA